MLPWRLRTRRRNQKRKRFHRARRFDVLREECLEPRLMLSADDIVVGRTLSAYSVADIQNNELTITYTVYNQQAEDVSGVLLTDSLLPGVTLSGASQLPDQ